MCRNFKSKRKCGLKMKPSLMESCQGFLLVDMSYFVRFTNKEWKWLTSSAVVRELLRRREELRQASTEVSPTRFNSA